MIHHTYACMYALTTSGLISRLLCAIIFDRWDGDIRAGGDDASGSKESRGGDERQDGGTSMEMHGERERRWARARTNRYGCV